MVRFMQKGTTRFYFLPTVASVTLAPTAAEVTAGTRLDTQLGEVNGFSFSNNPITTPDMANTFVPSIPGEETADDSSLKFYEDKTTNPIRTALAKGIVGYVAIFYSGIAGAAPAAADKCDVWPIQVASNVRGYSAGNEASMYTVSFTATSAPGYDKALT
jgi:hypothetical protein